MQATTLYNLRCGCQTGASTVTDFWSWVSAVRNALFWAHTHRLPGNGGMADTIDQPSLLSCVNRGFACAGGDSGHRASENNNGSGAPGVFLPYLHDREQTLAWIHNSIAYITPPARSIVESAYAKKPKYAYYQGCSTGGAQGFALAQYHPHLFDGIVAGSPGNWYSHLALSFLWNYVDEKVRLPLLDRIALTRCRVLPTFLKLPLT